MTTFSGRTVLISGASAGIGRALSLQLAAQGARLALNGRNIEALREVAAQCRSCGAEVLELPADLTHPGSAAALVEGTLARFGQLDTLVNNAGVSMWARFEDVSDLSAYQDLICINYLSAVRLTAAALPHLRRSRGLIVAVASVAGLTGVPERTAYAASKHAMIGFFESLRIELADSGVGVTIIAPDFVHSELHRRALGPDGQPQAGAPPRTRGITSEACARQILAGMQQRRRLVITSLRGRVGHWARLVVPALVDRIAARAVRTRR